jgi:phosphatidyl-myo-inositol dimannoside synthase
MPTPIRLLTLGHSYVIGANRALAHSLQQVGGSKWHVEVVAPNYFAARGDLRSSNLEITPEDTIPVHSMQAFNTARVHMFWYGLKLRQLLKQNWDIVYAWQEPFILAGAQIGFWTPKHTQFYFKSEQSLNKVYPQPFRYLEKWTLERATGWFCTGQSVENNLLARPGYTSRPHRRISHGVDTTRFAPNVEARRKIFQEFGWAMEGPPVVGFLGRFVPEKGLKILMDALSRIRSPWRAVFVGSGPSEEELVTWAKRYGDQVRVCNNVKHAEVPPYLNAMDMLACPSQTTPIWKEQFGRMQIEGFASGLPVIGSDSGEIPFVLQDTGTVVPEANVNAWTAALGNLIDNTALRQEMASRSRERALQDFAWPVIAKKHLDFFEEMLSKPA